MDGRQDEGTARGDVLGAGHLGAEVGAGHADDDAAQEPVPDALAEAHLLAEAMAFEPHDLGHAPDPSASR